MYEAGMITQEQYEYALREGRLPGNSNATSTTTEVQADAQAQPSGESQRKTIGPVTRDLRIDGEKATVKDLREKQRAKLAARAVQLRIKAQTERAEAEAYARKNDIPISRESEDGKFIEIIRLSNGKPIFYTTHNLVAAESISTVEVWTNGSAGLSLSGANTTIGVWDGDAVRLDHQEFTVGGTSRVTQMDGETNVIVHSTAVAGTLIAQGFITTAVGMSFQADLSAYDFVNDIPEMATAVVSNGLRISNHSYSLITGWEFNSFGFGVWTWWGDIDVDTQEEYKFGFYRGEARDIDEIVYDGNYYLPFWSAANEREIIDLGPTNQPLLHFAFEGSSQTFIVTNLIHNSDGDPGGFDTIPPQGVAKNNLTVGAIEDIPGGYTTTQDVVLASFSSLGPTDDGRIKPDVVANGTGLITTHPQDTNTYVQISGTSFSSPNAAGSGNLLRELHGSLFGTNPPLLASTLKGVIIHTADEAGDALGPDYSFGWGLMNTRSAAQLITDDFASGSKAHMKEPILLNSDYIEFPITATNIFGLKVTVVWTDPPGVVPTFSVDSTNLMLVNDLDLRVIDPSGVTNYPYVLDPGNPTNAATTGDNFRDNVEQIYIASPESGVYTVRITHKGTLSNGLQNVSILISGNIAQPKPEFEIVDLSTETTPTNIVTWASLVGQLYRVQETDDLLSGTWSDASGDISATKTHVVYPVSTNTLPDVLFYRALEVR